MSWKRYAVQFRVLLSSESTDVHGLLLLAHFKPRMAQGSLPSKYQECAGAVGELEGLPGSSPDISDHIHVKSNFFFVHLFHVPMFFIVSKLSVILEMRTNQKEWSEIVEGLRLRSFIKATKQNKKWFIFRTKSPDPEKRYPSRDPVQVFKKTFAWPVFPAGLGALIVKRLENKRWND